MSGKDSTNEKKGFLVRYKHSVTLRSNATLTTFSSENMPITSFWRKHLVESFDAREANCLTDKEKNIRGMYVTTGEGSSEIPWNFYNLGAWGSFVFGGIRGVLHRAVDKMTGVFDDLGYNHRNTKERETPIFAKTVKGIISVVFFVPEAVSYAISQIPHAISKGWKACKEKLFGKKKSVEIEMAKYKPSTCAVSAALKENETPVLRIHSIPPKDKVPPKDVRIHLRGAKSNVGLPSIVKVHQQKDHPVVVHPRRTASDSKTEGAISLDDIVLIHPAPGA